jgi:hypothetical protein
MINDILSAISAGETGTTEFKSTFQKEVIETVVAFANAKGGRIIPNIPLERHAGESRHPALAACRT